MPARFHRIIHQQAQVWSFETFYSNPESLTIVLLSKYIEWQPSSPWYSPNCCWKLFSLSDLVTTDLPQNHSYPKLPVAYQFSQRAILGTFATRVLKCSGCHAQFIHSFIHISTGVSIHLSLFLLMGLGGGPRGFSSITQTWGMRFSSNLLTFVINK